MISSILQRYKKIFTLLVLLLFAMSLQAKKFVYNSGVIVNKTEKKIEKMANELYAKTGVSAYLLAKHELGGQSIKEYEKIFASKINPPYTILIITLKEQKVDVCNSPDLDSQFDKKAMLSPYPWSGTIIPLLTGKKKYVSISAAMLNGYADMVEQIARARNIKLESGIGSTNKNMISFIKISVYLFLLIMIGWYFIQKRKR